MYEQSKSKELPVKIQKDLTTYLNYALPLCAILADDSMYPWFYQHFVQIYTLTSERGSLWVDYLEERDFCDLVAENLVYGYETLTDEKNIIEYLQNKINDGYYVVIYVDEFYLPRKLNYNRIHFIHQLMVYGYNNQTQTIKTIAFNEKHEFTNDEYEYSQFVQAYELGKERYQACPIWVRNETVKLLRMKDNIETYQFNLEIFLEELKIYLQGQGDYSKIRPNNLKTNGTQASFNFGVYNELNIHLNNLINGNPTMDYRYIHLLFEHKQIMYDRLSYIIKNYTPTEKLVYLLPEYSVVVTKMKITRALFFKQMTLRREAVLNETLINETLHSVIDNINFVKEVELKVLTEIYNELKLNL